MGPGRAVGGGAAYAAAGTFNSGILLFRATPRGKAFVQQWHQNVASPPRGSRFASLTIDPGSRRAASRASVRSAASTGVKGVVFAGRPAGRCSCGK
ncbi:MAG: hypothetical protein ACPGMZ_12335 [Candidatus Puniceispirillaceae bacterium]